MHLLKLVCIILITKVISQEENIINTNHEEQIINHKDRGINYEEQIINYEEQIMYHEEQIINYGEQPINNEEHNINVDSNGIQHQTNYDFINDDNFEEFREVFFKMTINSYKLKKYNAYIFDKSKGQDYDFIKDKVYQLMDYYLFENKDKYFENVLEENNVYSDKINVYDDSFFSNAREYIDGILDLILMSSIRHNECHDPYYKNLTDNSICQELLLVIKEDFMKQIYKNIIINTNNQLNDEDLESQINRIIDKGYQYGLENHELGMKYGSLISISDKIKDYVFENY
jgi:hypothetical protein